MMSNDISGVACSTINYSSINVASSTNLETHNRKENSINFCDRDNKIEVLGDSGKQLMFMNLCSA